MRVLVVSDVHGDLRGLCEAIEQQPTAKVVIFLGDGLRQAEEARASENLKDVTQLRAEVQALKEQLQLREKDLLAERQKNEELNQRQATRQQALMARIASLESPSIGTTQTLSTNQSREAKQVKLPRWMRLGG